LGEKKRLLYAGKDQKDGASGNRAASLKKRGKGLKSSGYGKRVDTTYLGSQEGKRKTFVTTECRGERFKKGDCKHM